MENYYEILGVPPDATAEEIKKAFRTKALQHHPDTNPEAGKPAADRFRQISEAYQVLRDEGRRRQYDAMRSGLYGGSSAGEGTGGWDSYSGPFGQPGMNTKDFDAAFDAWFKKMSEQFRDYDDERAQREASAAERMARAAAWELEKEEAKLNKVRAERLKRRTEDARHARQAATLRRYWQTHHGVTRQDMIFLALVGVSTAGLAFVWRAHLRKTAATSLE